MGTSDGQQGLKQSLLIGMDELGDEKGETLFALKCLSLEDTLGHPNDGIHIKWTIRFGNQVSCFCAAVNLPELLGFHLPMDYGGPCFRMEKLQNEIVLYTW